MVPVSWFNKPDDGSNKFFRESVRFGRVNSNPLADNPIVFEYLSGKIPSRVLPEKFSILWKLKSVLNLSFDNDFFQFLQKLSHIFHFEHIYFAHIGCRV